jgi:hypothetical protein
MTERVCESNGDEREAEQAVEEFLAMRSQILGRLSPAALRCVAGIFERRMEEKAQQRKTRVSDMSVTT